MKQLTLLGKLVLGVILIVATISIPSHTVMGVNEPANHRHDIEQSGNELRSAHNSQSLADIDGDGVQDNVDNCPYVYNPAQVDANSNEIGDACECAEPLFTLYGMSNDLRLGIAVAKAGDVNRDGTPDYIIGANGSAMVISGLEGDTLFTFSGSSADRFGWTVSGAGDVNNDTYPDILVGASRAGDWGYAKVYSGLDGAQLLQIPEDTTVTWWRGGFGIGLAGAGDLDGDGFDDVIVGGSGEVLVISGQTGSTLYYFIEETPADCCDRFGEFVSGIGDINNDATPDIVVGAYVYEPTPRTNTNVTGKVYVFSGIDGDTLHTFTGQNNLDIFGYSLASDADINGDGYADILIGAWGYDNGGAEGDNAGKAYLRSGMNGAEIFTNMIGIYPEKRNVGLTVSFTDDVNGDGMADMLIGSLHLPIVYSGANAGVLCAIPSYFTIGYGIDGIGDLTGDGLSEIIVPSPMDNTYASAGGRVDVYSFNDSDGDFIFTMCDNCPVTPNSDQIDSDGDGYGDACDICPGFDDNAESDGDGVPDGCDVCAGFDDAVDTDFDGVPDGCDICDGGDDALDADSDGTPDSCDNCPVADNPGQADSDADGLGDECDNCPTDHNPGQENNDGDTFGDVCDSDDDNDGTPDVTDNCPFVFQFSQTDTDLDGRGNACDLCPFDFDDGTDSDSDGTPDACDICPSDPLDVCTCCDTAGDADNSGSVNIADVTFLIARIFTGGPAPACCEEGDADGNGAITIGDVTYLIARIFGGGPAPICGPTGMSCEEE